MFDPLRITKNNKRIQQRSQILRPKGIFEIPNNVIDKRQIDKWKKILIANRIPAFIPPSPSTFPLIVKSLTLSSSPSSVEVSCNNDFLDNDFTLADTQTLVPISQNQILLKITNKTTEDYVLDVFCNYTSTTDNKPVFKDEWYYVGDLLPSSITLNVYTSDDPQTLIPLFAISTDLSMSDSQIAFNPNYLIPGIIRQ